MRVSGTTETATAEGRADSEMEDTVSTNPLAAEQQNCRENRLPQWVLSQLQLLMHTVYNQNPAGDVST